MVQDFGIISEKTNLCYTKKQRQQSCFIILILILKSQQNAFIWFIISFISYIVNDIMDVAISITNVFVSGLTVQNDRLNYKRKNVNSLLKGKCDKGKICFIDSTKINVGMLNNNGLHLNEPGTTRVVNNFCFNLAK